MTRGAHSDASGESGDAGRTLTVDRVARPCSIAVSWFAAAYLPFPTLVSRLRRMDIVSVTVKNSCASRSASYAQPVRP